MTTRDIPEIPETEVVDFARAFLLEHLSAAEALSTEARAARLRRSLMPAHAVAPWNSWSLVSEQDFVCDFAHIKLALREARAIGEVEWRDLGYCQLARLTDKGRASVVELRRVP